MATLVFLAGETSAQTVMTFTAGKDNTLYETNNDGSLRSNGQGAQLFVGRVDSQGGGKIRRALIAFDISTIPAGATIENVTLTLDMNRGPAATSQLIELRRVISDWGEGTSNASAEEGMGATPQTGDATWIHAFFNTALWAAPGGDFSLSISATQNVGLIGSYTWGSTAQMVADVQTWLDNPSENFGWILIGNETVPVTVKRFASKDNPDEAAQPLLTVTFTGPTSVESPPVAADGFMLFQNYPNPFNPTTIINYAIPPSVTSAHVRFEILDLLGQTVRTLVNTEQPGGTYKIEWDGKNDDGRQAGSGIYLYRLQAGNHIAVKKMTYLR
ncbi:MAG: DNRLRE domain-containing protein [bacterium]